MRSFQWRPEPPPGTLLTLTQAGLHPRIARALAQRGTETPEEALLTHPLLPFSGLKGIVDMARGLVSAILKNEHITVVADYDCDGATACTVAVSGLRTLGASIDFVVPNRFRHGYGLTPSVVDMVREHHARWIITVDNGIASLAGVEAANAAGMGVWVTDHHLPGDELPKAEGIVNPNQPGCTFPSKNLAGCGVMFYVLAAVQSALKALDPKGPYGEKARAMRIMDWIDVVALGTVADVVRLDENNRWLVNQGLMRIRKGFMRPGLAALFQVSGKDPTMACAQDFGFGIGPRLNAAGRLDDMSIGIRCLLSEDFDQALELAKELDQLNRKRKDIEGEVREISEARVEAEKQQERFTRVVFGTGFHEGVIGIVAGRIKEQAYTPTIVFAKIKDEKGVHWKGSGRSIPGCHLRDVLDMVYKKHPSWFVKFGGHAMAAGMTITDEARTGFADAFEEAVKTWFDGVRPEASLPIDGILETKDLTLDTTTAIHDNVWGQGFEEPIWTGVFQIRKNRMLGKDHNHLKMDVCPIDEGAEPPPMDIGWGDRGPATWTAMHFFQHEEDAPNDGDVVVLAYKLSRNFFRGQYSVNLLVEDRSEAFSDAAAAWEWLNKQRGQALNKNG